MARNAQEDAIRRHGARRMRNGSVFPFSNLPGFVYLKALNGNEFAEVLLRYCAKKWVFDERSAPARIWRAVVPAILAEAFRNFVCETSLKERRHFSFYMSVCARQKAGG